MHALSQLALVGGSGGQLVAMVALSRRQLLTAVGQQLLAVL